jgi:hypothetical protein
MLFRHACAMFVLAAVVVSTTLAADQVATVPPMGWNSYDSYGALVTEDQFRANVDFLAQRLKPHGYEYAVLDYCWSYPFRATGRTGSEALNQAFNADDKTFKPQLAMDDFGRLIPDRSRFPSAYDGSGNFIGLNALIDDVHRKGLKFGLHIMRGIPRQAVVANTPVFGSQSTAAEIANTESKTTWLNHMYGLKTTDGRPTGELTAGGQAYYDSILKMYAAWGVDFIKADDMLRDFSKSDRSFYAGEMNGVRLSIDRCGRPMVLSLSPGAAPLAHADELVKTSNMWRMLDDMWDRWRDVNLVFDVARNWTPSRGPGHWPDADMLPLGTFVRPPVGRSRRSSLTANEERTMMTLWSIAKSPLIIGGDLSSLAGDPDTFGLLTNDAVLQVDQHSAKNRRIALDAESAVWAAEDPQSSDVFVALFNRSGAARSVSVRLSDLGLSGGAHGIKDLWTGDDLGKREESLERSLDSHAAGLYRISAKSAP